MSLRELAWRGLHLLVLCSFALAQPLFDLLARNPEFFATRRSTAGEVVGFAIAITLAPPALGLLAEALAGLASPRLARALHLVLVAGLVALVALSALSRLAAGPGVLLVGAAIAIGAGAALAYSRSGVVRSFVTVASFAPPLFAGLFLLYSPVTKLVLPRDPGVAMATVAARTPVVVLVMDELPVTSLMDGRRRIDAVRYPNFAALAADSTWFRNTTTPHGVTPSAVPAILTGRYVANDKLPVLEDHPRNLFTLLGASYRLNVSEEVTELCPEELCANARDPLRARLASLLSDLAVAYGHVIAPRDLREGLPSITGTWRNFGAGDGKSPTRDVPVIRSDQSARLDRFLAAVQPGSRPTLHFLHLLLPHGPWKHLPSGRRYDNSNAYPGLVDERWSSDPWLVTQAYQRHLLQLGFADRELGRLIGHLKRHGLYHRSLLVVLSDHGVSFQPGGWRRPVSAGNVADVAPTALFVKRPRQRVGIIDDAAVRTIDVLPTIADLLGVPLRGAVDGRSAFAARPGPRRRLDVMTDSGARIELEPRSFERAKAAALERKLALFGSRRERPGLFGIGPHPELIGRRVDGVARLAPVRAEIEDAELLRSVDPSADFLPARITGRLTGAGGGRRRDLAVALNGRIAAVSRSYTTAGKPWFSALVPETALRRGPNAVAVLEVKPSPE